MRMVDTCPASGRPGRRGPKLAQPSLARSFPPSAWRRSRSSRRARSPEVLFFHRCNRGLLAADAERIHDQRGEDRRGDDRDDPRSMLTIVSSSLQRI
jgi:hypothetical protein